VHERGPSCLTPWVKSSIGTQLSCKPPSAVKASHVLILKLLDPFPNHDSDGRSRADLTTDSKRSLMLSQILTGMLRHYATVLLGGSSKPLGLAAIREQRSLIWGIGLRNNAAQLSASSFASRRDYIVSSYKDGKFLKDPENRGKPAANPMTDPAAMDGMMNMMKGNMMMMIPQTMIMGWINAFFAGYVICTPPISGFVRDWSVS
jgi:hypothetical protein